jgi:L-lactate utilization protein LutB
MPTWNQIPSDDVIKQTAAALEANGVHVIVVKNSAEAKAKALELIPTGAEVMTMTSVTVDTVGLSDTLNRGEYNSVRNTLTSLPKDTDPVQKLKIGAAPEWVVGSVHAISQDGHVMVASQTGSQLPAYANGSANVLWVAGAQKIVPTLKEAYERIEQYVLPLEGERANKAYHITTGSAINKLFILMKEKKAGRITLILVKEVLGF